MPQALSLTGAGLRLLTIIFTVISLNAIRGSVHDVGEPNEEFQLQIDVEKPDGSSLLGSPVLSHRLPGYGAWDSWLAFRPIPLHAIGPYRFVLKLNLLPSAAVLLPVEQVVH